MLAGQGIVMKVFLETMGCQMNVLDSELVASLLRSAGMELVDDPRLADVTITEPGFFMPLMVMQLCEASSTTATPSGCRLVIMKSAI